MSEQKLVTIPEAAGIIGIHPDTILKAIRRKVIPAQRYSKYYLVTVGDVQAYLDARKRGRPPKKSS